MKVIGQLSAFINDVLAKHEELIRDALDSDSVFMTKVKSAKMLSRTSLAVVKRAKKSKVEFLKFNGCSNVVKAVMLTGDPKDKDLESAALAIYNNEGTVADMYRYLRGDAAPSNSFSLIN